MAPENDIFIELKRTIETCNLELAYEKACHHLERECEVEKARQLRVQIHLQEDENNILKARLASHDECIARLEGCTEELQVNLVVASTNLDAARSDLRIKTREIDTLKAELNSLHGLTIDSAKLLTEKLALARDLSSLKPEIDHLRSQAASHQSLLAEKLSLQKQLNTVQEELEAEKRSSQRILAKENKSLVEEAKLKSRIEALQADIAKERREWQRREREAQKAFAESENRTAALETRLETSKTKLKATKEQLKDTQTALATAQNSAPATSTCAKRPTKSASLTSRSRKRAAIQMDADTTTGTPGAWPAAKKSKIAPSLVGEKSTFSITPFLNRTACIAPESPPSSVEGNRERTSMEVDGVGPEDEKLEEATETSVRRLHTKERTAQSRESMGLENAKLAKPMIRGPIARNTRVTPMLEQVAEEGNTKDLRGLNRTKSVLISTDALNDTCQSGAEVRKKRRKLFGGGSGRTLFDEDEGDFVKNVKSLSAVNRSSAGLARPGAAGPLSASMKTLGHGLGAFGTISPLKKDKRGAA